MLRVLVAAAYPMTRAGLAALLAETPEIAVAATVADVATAVAEMEPAAPDVILLAPGDDVEEWLDDLARLAGESGAPPVLLLVDTPELASEALRAGVAGLLLRDADPDEIVAALRAAGQGLTVLDPRAVPFLTTDAAPRASPDAGEPLTPREREILQLIAQGLPNKSIALELGISEHTVKFHVGSILDKLGASSRAEALARAARAGLIVL